MHQPHAPIHHVHGAHCCACLMLADHDEFDSSGCEFCDPTVVLAFDGKTIVLRSECFPDDEFRYDFLTLKGPHS